MTLEKATSWLKLASIVTIAFGLFSALAAFPGLTVISRPFAALALWPFSEAQSTIGTETKLLWAILGGITTGWGVMFWLLTTRLFHKEPNILRPIMMASVVSWFIVDGIGSVMSGAGFNAVLNLIFFALFIIPLWRPVSVEATA